MRSGEIRPTRPDSTMDGASFEAELMYFGRLSEFLRVTSEKITITDERDTLGRLLQHLRCRGGAWAYELAEHQVLFTVDGVCAQPSCRIQAGVEIGLFSRKSIFEA